MPSSTPTTRIALYARVSTRDKGQDTENQILQLESYAATKPGWRITRRYVDEESGAKATRTQFTRLFADAEKGAFDLVLVWSLDRWSREGVWETLNHLRRLDGFGVGFVSYKEELINTAGPFREVIISLLAALAKQERTRHIERVNAGLEKAIKNGVRLGRKPVAFDTESALALYRAGKSYRDIAVAFKVSHGTVGRVLGPVIKLTRKKEAGTNGTEPET